MHLGMPECHKPFLGHCDLDLWPRFQELLCPEHISYIIWCRNPKFGVVIPLGMAEWCIPFWVTLTLTLTSGLIASFFELYYSYLSSNVSYTRPIPLGAFVTCLWHFLFSTKCRTWRNVALTKSRMRPIVVSAKWFSTNCRAPLPHAPTPIHSVQYFLNSIIGSSKPKINSWSIKWSINSHSQ